MERTEVAQSLPTVHMFWHDAPLSRLERLCMASFIAQGHRLDLYVYEEPVGLPAQVHLMDASQVLAREYLFRHRRSGSLASFSDWFRYRLLLERGGIWADTDVVCLAPLRYDTPVVFGWQDPSCINTAVLGLPGGHELAAWLAACCEHPNRVLPYDTWSLRWRKWRRRYLHGDRRDGVRWGEYGPKGLTQAALHFGYAGLAQPIDHFYPVRLEDWRSMFESAGSTPPWTAQSRAVHLWNQKMRGAPGFDKNGRFPDDSPIEQLCRRYLKSDG